MKLKGRLRGGVRWWVEGGCKRVGMRVDRGERGCMGVYHHASGHFIFHNCMKSKGRR